MGGRPKAPIPPHGSQMIILIDLSIGFSMICTERMIFQPRKSTFTSSELSMLHCYTLCWSFRLYRSCFYIIIQSSIHIRLFFGSSIKSETFIFLQPIKGRHFQDREGKNRPIVTMLPCCPAMLDIKGVSITSNLFNQLVREYTKKTLLKQI